MNTLLVVGSGSLARSICSSLAVLARVPLSVVVVARNPAKVAEVVEVANVRAVAAGAPARFAGIPVDLTDTAALASVLAAAAPSWVAHVASYQSPWEHERTPSAWTALLTSAGFAATAALHAGLAAHTAVAIERSGTGAHLLNACFPDAVNPILAGLELPVVAGLGNVGLIAASLRHTLGLTPPDRLRVIAHHVHLHAPDDPRDEAMAWVNDQPVPDVAGALRTQRSITRSELNSITGFTAALVLNDLAAGVPVAVNLPGPGGRPGGYPVRIEPDGALALDLPPGWTEEAAVAWNARAGWREGLRLEGTDVRFNEPTRAALKDRLPSYAAGFAVGDLDAVCHLLLAARGEMRATPH